MKYILSLVFVSFCAISAAQESITLTAPIPSVNAYVPGSLFIELRPRPVITVVIVHEASGRQERFEYPCDAPCAMDTPAKVAAMIKAISNTNLATRSLWFRLFDRLVLDFPDRFTAGVKVE